MPAIDYTSTGEIASYMYDFGSDPSTQAGTLLGLLITRESRFIDTYTGRQFWTSTADEVKSFDGIGSYRFMSPQDIVSITTLQLAVDTKAASSGTYTTIDSNDYALMPRSPRTGWPYSWIELSNQPIGDYSTSLSYTAFSAGYRTVKITGKFGWGATGSSGVPDDIRQATVELVVRAWRSRSMNFSDQIGAEGLQVGMFSHGLPHDVYRTLESYKRRNVR